MLAELTLFNSFHLVDAANVTLLPAKIRVQKGLCGVLREHRPNDACAEDQHVHVVVFHALVSGVMIVTHSCANALEFVCSDRHADATTTDENSTLCLAGSKILSYERGVIGIVVRLIRLESAYIVNRVAEFLDKLDQLPFHLVTGVICSNGNLHRHQL